MQRIFEVASEGRFDICFLFEAIKCLFQNLVLVFKAICSHRIGLYNLVVERE